MDTMVDSSGVVSALESRRQHRTDALVNQERLLAAATSAVLREGVRVPMATIAADAGIGIGTLYRSYPAREALLDAISRRSFNLVLDNARTAESTGMSGVDSVTRFFDGAIARHGELALPLHGGPAITTAETFALRGQVHDTLGRIVARGHDDGTIRTDADTVDIVMFAAMLAQPLGTDPDWATTAHRLKVIYVAGLAPHRSTGDRATG